jgi:hypothetical protein
MLRLALVFVALTALSACNMLMTQQPVFGRPSEIGAPAMRLGVWAEQSSDDCKFDETQPLAAWPSCANGFVVLPDGKLGAYNSQNGQKPVWQTTGYIMASGDPRVFQIHMTGAMASSLPMPQLYVYAGLKPTKLDDLGHVIAAESWPVQCGPPPPDKPPSDGSPQRFGTEHPLPGMMMDAQGNNCTATDPDAVRAAAKASRQWTKESDMAVSHWVRDGDK